MWPSRRPVGQTAFGSTRLGSAALRLVEWARGARRELSRRRTRPAAKDGPEPGIGAAEDAG
jgi:hypothetical protein